MRKGHETAEKTHREVSSVLLWGSVDWFRYCSWSKSVSCFSNGSDVYLEYVEENLTAHQP